MKNSLPRKPRDVSSQQQATPSCGLWVLLTLHRFAPDLSAEGRVVVHDSDAHSTLRRSHGGRDAGWASSDHQNVEEWLRIPTHRFSLPCPVHKGSGNFGNAFFH